MSDDVTRSGASTRITFTSSAARDLLLSAWSDLVIPHGADLLVTDLGRRGTVVVAHGAQTLSAHVDFVTGELVVSTDEDVGPHLYDVLTQLLLRWRTRMRPQRRESGGDHDERESTPMQLLAVMTGGSWIAADEHEARIASWHADAADRHRA